MNSPSSDGASAGVPTGSVKVEPTEMELRVARALVLSAPVDLHGDDDLVMARAAIRAMREPTDGMLEQSGTVENWGEQMGAHEYADEMHRDWWRSMIDAASPTPLIQVGNPASVTPP